jgi:hypothetical protein
MNSKDPFSKYDPRHDWRIPNEDYRKMINSMWGVDFSKPQTTVEKNNFKSDFSAGGPGGGSEKKKKPLPGSPEHKANRWEKYQARGGKKSNEAWSKQYDTNMYNYQYGAAREEEYRVAMGASEGTLKTPLTNRQIDILKRDEMYAGQLKTGPVSLTNENAIAIQKDAELVKEGWQVEHILEKSASKPYIKALEKAKVDCHIGPKIS